MTRYAGPLDGSALTMEDILAQDAEQDEHERRLDPRPSPTGSRLRDGELPEYVEFHGQPGKDFG